MNTDSGSGFLHNGTKPLSETMVGKLVSVALAVAVAENSIPVFNSNSNSRVSNSNSIFNSTNFNSNSSIGIQAGKLTLFGTCPNWVVSYIAYTKFHSPRPVFHSPRQIFTRIGERASASFPAGNWNWPEIPILELNWPQPCRRPGYRLLSEPTDAYMRHSVSKC